jgi:hypothetical protein
VDVIGWMELRAASLVSAVVLFYEVPMRVSLLIAACALAMAGLTACHQEGPGERAGRSLDNAGQSVRDTLDPPRGPVESAGRKVDRTLGN